MRTKSFSIVAIAAALFANLSLGAGPELPVLVQEVDGQTYTQVLFSGGSEKYDIVFIGDGFTTGPNPANPLETQQDLFNKLVDKAVAALGRRTPYSKRMCAFNVWRVNVISTVSGVGHPPLVKSTALNCRYGNPDSEHREPERCITTDSPEKCIEAADHAPAHDAIVVLVNDDKWGGCTGDFAVFCSSGFGFEEILLHELGHQIGWLADEYPYYFDEQEDGPPYDGPEPAQVNLTKESSWCWIKWNDLINTTQLPTTSQPAGQTLVGAWEGGGYYKHGLFRPQSSCLMNSHGTFFCAVCERQVQAQLSPFCSDSELEVFYTEPGPGQ